MKDAWPFLGALLVIIILAIVAGEKRKEEALTGGSSTSTPSFFGSTQPPSNTPDSQGETNSTTPTPERTEPPLTPEQVEYKVATLYRELDALREDLRVARLHEPASPYANTVTLRQGDVYTEDPDREYLILEANRNNTAGIPLSRWYLTSYVTDESAHLPRGDRILEKWRSPVSDDIVLLPGETAYLITGDSPIDVSFRENICTGYLANEGDFFPGLSRQCPRPNDELSRFGNIELDNDRCYDFIERLGTCVTPEDEEYTQAKVGGVCSDDLLNVIVILESAIEFVEDDLPEIQSEGIKTKLKAISFEVGKLAETFRAGRLIREGLRVALVGRPNVGKSSLFNALLGSERAIVTEIAGTTRDQIHERFTIGDIPISLIDTAGLRETTDMVESIGVERSRATMAEADIVIVMLDASEQISDEDREILESVKDLNYIVALNKIDKLPSTDIDKIVAGEHSSLAYLREKITPVSAKTGDGLDDLRNNIVRPFAAEDVSTSGFLVTDARHHDLLVRCKAEIEQSLEQLGQKISEEIVLIGLHNALRYLGQITGETTPEDMLTRIFSTFCIGK